MHPTEEIWKPLPSDDKFIISNYGNVLIRNYNCSKGNGRTVPASLRLISGTGTTWDGYVSTNLRGKCKLVHTLVGETFLENPNNYKQINHKDGNKSNNYFDNLEYSSQAYNCKHSYDIGTNPVAKKKGSMNGRAKLDEMQVRVIRSCYPEIGQVALGRYFGVSQSMIGCIVRRRHWTHI